MGDRIPPQLFVDMADAIDILETEGIINLNGLSPIAFLNILDCEIS